MARILITSAIPYINGIKHLGNLVGSQLPADLYARYMRGRGHEVMFICATDEHGTPAELAAAKAGQPVEQFCAEMHEVQKDIADGFRLSFDHFGRSSSARNHRLTQHFAGQLADERLHRGSVGKAGLFHRRQPLPARPLYRGHLPELRLRQGPRRPVRELHQAARPDRPDQPALGHLRLDRPRGARDQAPLPAPARAARQAARRGSTARPTGRS